MARFNTIFSIIVAIFSLNGARAQPVPPSNAGRPAPVTDCDRRAASPTDPDRVGDISGVATDAIVAELAIAACIDAIKTHPGERRFEFQLSRAFHKAGRQAEEITELKTAADMGSVPAMNNLGVMYRTGQGVAKDEPAAIRLFRKAADTGFALAMTNLGQMYQQGLGVDHDDVEAARLFRGAADGGNSIAMVNLGYLYQKGLGVAVDAQEAARWYRKAADAGNSVGMTNLAIMNESGLGIAKNESEAAAFYRKAADAGNAVAMFKLALMYEQGSGGLSKDSALTLQFLQQAAKGGNQDAAIKLASLKSTTEKMAATPTVATPEAHIVTPPHAKEERAPAESTTPDSPPSPSNVQSALQSAPSQTTQPSAPVANTQERSAATNTAAPSNDLIDYKLNEKKAVITIGKVATATSMCQVFDHPIFGHSFSELQRIGFGEYHINNGLDRQNLMKGWLRDRVKGSGWYPVDENIIEENMSSCLKSIFNSNVDKYNTIHLLFLAISQHSDTPCFDRQYKTVIKIDDAGHKYENRVPIGDPPKCADFSGNMIGITNIILLMTSLEEAHPVLSSVLDDLNSEVSSKINKVKAVDAANAEALREREAELEKQKEQAAANERAMEEKSKKTAEVFAHTEECQEADRFMKSSAMVTDEQIADAIHTIQVVGANTETCGKLKNVKEAIEEVMNKDMACFKKLPDYYIYSKYDQIINLFRMQRDRLEKIGREVCWR
jgi:TPR repeat protein